MSSILTETPLWNLAVILGFEKLLKIICKRMGYFTKHSGMYCRFSF